MISAVEALRLPSAKLTVEELQAADELEKMIDAHVQKFMAWRGFDFIGKETRPNVIAEVNQRLRAAGFQTEIRFTGEKNRFNAAAPPTITGFSLNAFPTDEAYKAATSLS